MQSIGDGVSPPMPNRTIDYINPVAEELTGAVEAAWDAV